MRPCLAMSKKVWRTTLWIERGHLHPTPENRERILKSSCFHLQKCMRSRIRSDSIRLSFKTCCTLARASSVWNWNWTTYFILLKNSTLGPFLNKCMSIVSKPEQVLGPNPPQHCRPGSQKSCFSWRKPLVNRSQWRGSSGIRCRTTGTFTSFFTFSVSLVGSVCNHIGSTGHLPLACSPIIYFRLNM